MNHSTTLNSQAWNNIRFMQKSAFSLVFIKMFLIIPFCVLYSTLILFLTKHLHINDSVAANITASFLAYTGIVRIIAGYLGDRFFSFRSLLAISALAMISGCILTAFKSTMYFGITLITIGSGLSIAVNCILTEIFQSDNRQREKAFLYNYSGMNIGYIIGYLFCGYFQLKDNYLALFACGSCCGLIALGLIYSNWKYLNGKNSSISTLNSLEKNKAYAKGLCLLCFLMTAIYLILQYSITSNVLIFIVELCMIFVIGKACLGQQCSKTRDKIIAYLLLIIPALLFWTLYNLIPLALTLFIERNVDRHYLGMFIAPQWTQIISTIVIIFGGPILCMLFTLLRKRDLRIEVPQQFQLALVLIGLSFGLLSMGIYYCDARGYTNFNWIATSSISQSIGELLIAPIGFAMIGQLAPVNLRGIMMGNWMMLIGLGAITANYISQIIFSDNLHDSISPLVTNVSYSKVFLLLCLVSLVIAMFMYFLPKYPT